jgi:hypothetical protein
MLFDYWNEFCDSEVILLNYPALDFVELVQNELKISPSGCTTPSTYTLEFGFPSYPSSYSLNFIVTENVQWTISTSPIAQMIYIVSVSSGLTYEFEVFIEVGDSKKIFDCQDLIIGVVNGNDLSPYI